MRNDSDGPAPVRGRDRLERRPRARGQLIEVLALGKLIAGYIRLPRGERCLVEAPDLVRGEALPAPHGELAQCRQRDGWQFVRGGQDLGTAPRAQEITGVHRLERDTAETL